MDIPTALFHQLAVSLANGGVRLPLCVRCITIGGEAVGLEYLRQWFESSSAQTVELVNTYGTTEAGAVVAMDLLEDSAVTLDKRHTAIGRPLNHCKAYVLDESYQPLPAGCVGELHIGGSGIARCYVNQPAMTAASFVPDPFSQFGERMYKTGDLARWSATGTLEYCGRSNHSLKIRGHRIELEDVEQCILRMSGVQACAAVCRSDSSGSSKLVCFVVPDQKFLGVDEFKTRMRGELPAYMTPSLVYAVDSLPETPTGKIDRIALQARVPGLSGAAHQSRPPSNSVEAKIAAFWAEILEVDHVGVDEDVFALGANSLNCIQVASRIRDEFGVELPIHLMFSHTRVAEIAVEVSQAKVDQSTIEFADGRV
jgi:acyl-coenzyme A synthetase/AMP-(fatty) acid ligase/acyl carrier protein